MWENCRNNCDCHKQKAVKISDVLDWMGSDNWDKESLASVIAEVANGYYKPEELKEDIQSYEYE